MPDFSFETEAAFRLHRDCRRGRSRAGPLCGPVTAAAVILDPDHIPDGLRDSKN